MWRVFIPLRVLNWFSEGAQSLRMAFGCTKSKIHMHDFQWGMGPDSVVREDDGLVLKSGGHGWWMYCTKCGKAVGDD
jgi:hypothetical protein